MKTFKESADWGWAATPGQKRAIAFAWFVAFIIVFYMMRHSV